MTVVSFRKYHLEKKINHAKQMRFELLAEYTMNTLADQVLDLMDKNDEVEFLVALRGIINIVLDAEHQFTLRQGRG